jgi:hypothetical protein
LQDTIKHICFDGSKQKPDEVGILGGLSAVSKETNSVWVAVGSGQSVAPASLADRLSGQRVISSRRLAAFDYGEVTFCYQQIMLNGNRNRELR